MRTPSPALTRRQLITVMGGAALSAPLLAGCTGSGDPNASPSGTSAGTGAADLTWWDHKNGVWIDPTLDRFAGQHNTITIKRQQYPAPELVKSLQLAKRSNQLPDVHTAHPNLGPISVLVQEDWFQPIGDHVDLSGTVVGDQLIEGIHTFDGLVYSFPLQDGRAHEQTPWVVADRLTAEVDPTEAESWDGFRAVARQLTGDGSYAIAFAAKGPNYLKLKLEELASAAGATHVGGVDYSTGEYVFDSQPFLEAMEFLLALNQDKVLHPSLGSMGPPDAAQRWAAGEAQIHWHGPWVPGVVKEQYPELLEQGFTAWRMPTPSGARSPVHFAPSAGEFWVSSASAHPVEAAQAIAAFASEQTFVDMANAMAAPPLDAAAVDRAEEASEPYKQNLAWLREDCRYAPAPEARNPEVVRVIGELQPINPNPAEIVQGALTGTIDDWKRALTDYTSKINTERDRAIKKVVAAGGKVDVDDWVFANWKPSDDFTADDYS